MSAPKRNKAKVENGYSTVLQVVHELEQRINHSDTERLEMVKDLAEARTKLDNHDKVLEAATPKKPDWLVISGIVAAFLGMLAGGIYFVSTGFAERPTVPVVQKLIDPQFQDIKDIKEQQNQMGKVMQKVSDSLDNLQQDFTEMKDDVKQIKQSR